MTTEHLSPEAFVDVLDGAPVDASWRCHLEACARCQEELAELKGTLSLLSEDVAVAPAHKRSIPMWALTAAAVVAAAIGLGFLVNLDRNRAPDTAETVELELLPPVEDDEEFQLLRAISEASDVELAELADQAFEEPMLDTGPLTPGERQRFVERLTEEMRSSL